MDTISESLSCIARPGWFEKLHEEMLVGAGEIATDQSPNPEQSRLEREFEGVAMVVIEEAIHDNSHALDAPKNWVQRRNMIQTYFKHINDPDTLWVIVLDRLLSFTLPSSSGEPPSSIVTRAEAEDLVDAFVKVVSPKLAKERCDARLYQGYRCDQLKNFLTSKYDT